MWVFTDQGFIAIVQHNRIEDHFQVKSRVIDPLEIFWPENEIEIIKWADYRFRVTIPKEKVLKVLIEKASMVNYTSFKDECMEDVDYHRALVRVWSAMHAYQQASEASHD